MLRLVREELGFCCIYSFLREVKGRSATKVAKALGVTNTTIYYWREKKFHGTLKPCKDCRKPNPELDLVKTQLGRYVFRRAIHPHPLRRPFR